MRTGGVGSNGKIQRPQWEGSATPNIVIVGAGFGGIGLGALLRRSGIDSFTIYDKADHVGGTWWHNKYPGAEVDTVSYVYSYPFKPYAWTRSHARRAELLRYLEDTVEEFGLRSHLELGVAVESADWNDETHRYSLQLSTGESASCHVLVAATGFLNIPKYPSWPGLENFAGPKISHGPLGASTRVSRQDDCGRRYRVNRDAGCARAGQGGKEGLPVPAPTGLDNSKG